MTASRLTEDELIAELFAPLATSPGADGLGDDAATLPPGEGEIVVTTDALAAGVHFFPDDPAEAIAAKALRANLSDLAAKGAEPVGYVVALALGEGWTADWVKGFAAGLAADNERYRVALLGGDTLRAAGGTTVCITAFGRTTRVVRRRTARPGDVVTVTGTIGDAALGLLCRLGRMPQLPEEACAPLRQAYLYPDPPVGAWRAVRDHASAAMDVSDGLVGDLAKLCRTAGVGATLDADAVPFAPEVAAAIAADPALRDRALTGGDDYQVLATVPPERLDAYRAALAEAGVALAAIGRIETGPGVSVTSRGRPLAVADGRFRHF